METYSTGAKRSDHKPYYREIPVAVLRRLGEALREGALKYNEQPWDSNWQKGDLTFALDCIDHLGDHFACYAESVKARLAGKPTRDEEDHLGHLLANAAFLAWFEERGMFVSRVDDGFSISGTEYKEGDIYADIIDAQETQVAEDPIIADADNRRGVPPERLTDPQRMSDAAKNTEVGNFFTRIFAPNK